MAQDSPYKLHAGSAALPPPPTPITKPKLGRRHPALRRGLWTLLVVLSVLVIVAFLLPIWASTPQGREYALQHINQRIHGNLQVRSWNLGWFSGLKMEGVKLGAGDGQAVLECSSVQSDLTLWGFVWGRYDVGTMTLSSPRISLRQFPDGSNDLSRIWFGPPASVPAGVDPATTVVTGGGAWSLKTLRGSFKVERGELILQLVNGQGGPGGTGGLGGGAGKGAPPPPLHLTQVAAEMPIAASSAPIHLTLQARSLVDDRQGLIDFKGDLPALANWGKDPSAFLQDMQLTASVVPVQALLRWLSLAGAWQEALGRVLDEVTFDAHHAGGHAKESIVTARVRSAVAALDLRLVSDSTGKGMGVRGGGRELILRIPDTTEYYARAKVVLAGPTVRALAYLNPIFREAQFPGGVVEVSIDRGQMALEQPTGAFASMLLEITNLKLRRTEGGLLGQILTLSAPPSSPSHPTRLAPLAVLAATVPPIRVTIEKGLVRAEPVQIILEGQQRWIFTGNVALDGTVNLLLTLPLETAPGAPAGTLGGATLQLPITGTVDQPQLVLPRLDSLPANPPTPAKDKGAP